MKDKEGEEVPPSAFFEMAADGPEEPAEIAAELVESCEEFAHLKLGQPVILFLMRQVPKVKSGRWVLGEMCLPRFMGGLAPVGSWLLAKACGGTTPDFLLLIDREWWHGADGRKRRALVHHELKHIGHALDREGEPKFDDDGNPVWALEGHDIEEFKDTVERFGQWSPDIPLFVEALRKGGAL